jgi:hypothetical protein
VDGEARLGVLICNEELEPDLAARAVRRGANLLVGMVNDAWFGVGPAPYQHFALAVFRAVETRRQLLRATSTGVSGHVDALGRVRLAGPLYEAPKGPNLDPTLLSTEVSLLDVPTPGPFMVPRFPAACALVLGAAVLIRKVARPRPVRQRSPRRTTGKASLVISRERRNGRIPPPSGPSRAISLKADNREFFATSRDSGRAELPWPRRAWRRRSASFAVTSGVRPSPGSVIPAFGTQLRATADRQVRPCAGALGSFKPDPGPGRGRLAGRPVHDVPL